MKKVKLTQSISILLIITILCTGCNVPTVTDPWSTLPPSEPSDIPVITQSHEYPETPIVDYSLTGIPEFVTDISQCVDHEKQYVLPDGYLYEIKSVPVYSNENCILSSTDENGSIYNGIGYMDNSRIRGILELGEYEGTFTTGFIPVKEGDKLYFSGNCFDPAFQNAHILNIAFYNKELMNIGKVTLQDATKVFFEELERNEDGYISAIKIRRGNFKEELAFVRLTLIGSGADEIISINEPLTVGEYRYDWKRSEKYISSSWYDEISATVKTVNEIDVPRDTKSARFILASDIHLGPDSVNSYTNKIGKVSAEVMRACDIPFFITAGDNSTQSSGFMPNDFYQNMDKVLNELSPIPQKNILLAVGNHDGATGSKTNFAGETEYYCYQLNNEQRSEVFFDWQRKTNEHKHFDYDGTYYFIDDPETKTRYIVLNSHWSQFEGNEDGYVTDIQNNFFKSPLFGRRQLNWFAKRALDLPPDYAAVMIAHHAKTSMDFELFKGIVDAFNNRTTYYGEYIGTEDWQNTQISVNYENANGEIIALFQGHDHTDIQYDYFDKVPCINITTAGAHWAVRDDYFVERVKDTATEFAVDVVTIDRISRKIYMTRLGAGYDRVIDY